MLVSLWVGFVLFCSAVHGIVFFTSVNLYFQHSVYYLFRMLFSSLHRAKIENQFHHNCWCYYEKWLNYCKMSVFEMQESREKNEKGIIKYPIGKHFPWVIRLIGKSRTLDQERNNERLKAIHYKNKTRHWIDKMIKRDCSFSWYVNYPTGNQKNYEKWHHYNIVNVYLNLGSIYLKSINVLFSLNFL